MGSPSRGVEKGLILTFSLAPPALFMSFTSTALNLYYEEYGEIRVDRVFVGSFRTIVWLRFARRILITCGFFVLYVAWLGLRMCAKLLAMMGCGDGEYASSNHLREHTLVSGVCLTQNFGRLTARSATQ